MQYRHKITGVIMETPCEIHSESWIPQEAPAEAPKKTPAKKTPTRKKVQKDGGNDVHDA